VRPGRLGEEEDQVDLVAHIEAPLVFRDVLYPIEVRLRGIVEEDVNPAVLADREFTCSASQALIRDWYGVSRLFASTLIRSSSASGSRREIVCVDGLRFGSRTEAARLQSR
jgi:hypothetical protein